MSFSADDLLACLALEPIEQNIFRGRSPDVGWQRVFGGLVISQALAAATRTVGQRAVHSLHGYFMLPGDPAVPIVYEVERLRDGTSFTTRHCVAIQHGRPIFSLSASFYNAEAGLEHAAEMPTVPQPDALPSETDILQRYGAVMLAPVRRYFERERPIELRPVELARYRAAPAEVRPSLIQNVWMRSTGPLPDDPAIHCAVLAYLSDMTLLDTALLVHGRSVFDPDMQVASLDHALWFHRPFRADDWLLYAQDSPSAAGSRAFTRGQIFTREGQLVASVAQEGLARHRGAPRQPTP